MPIRIAVFLLAALLSQAQSSWFTGQPGANPAVSKNRYKVSGTVINAQTGEPIPRALVSGPGLTNGPVFTDGSGKFEADNVPEGTAFFTAQRPGFFAQSSAGAGNFMARPVYFPIDAEHNSVQVKLVPAATIHGRAIGSDNQPVESIYIQLLARTMTDGFFGWRPMNSVNTDETGLFAFRELQPGSYLLRTAPRRLYLDATDLVIDGQHYPDLYASAYFPGVPDRASAQPITVTPGADSEADIRVPLVATYSLSGATSSGIRGNVGCLDENTGFISAGAMIDPRTGKFRLTGVPPGPCTLRAQSFGSQGQGPVAELPVNVTSDDLTGLSLVFRDPLPDIPITVKGMPPDQKSQPLNLSLIPKEERHSNQTQIQNQNDADGVPRYFIRKPGPGAYRLTASSFGQTCVATIQAGGVDLMKEDLVISRDSAPAQIEVALRTDCGSVEISTDGATANGMASVVIVGGQSSPRLVYMGAKLTLSSLSPGDYTFYALTDAGNLEYGKPEVLKKLSGQQLTIAPSAKATIQLKVQMPPVDAAP